jgi:hypothetical protein
MRQALNNNPKVQIATIGVLVVVVGLFFMMNMKKSGSSSPASSAVSATSGAAGSTASATPGTTSPVTVGGSASAGASAPSTGSAGPITLPSESQPVTPDSLIPGPGLPRPVAKAYKSGDAIALLIVRGGAIDDRLVRQSVEQLSREGVAVFVARAKDVARYSRITAGAGVDRTPALVVVRPRKESGATPQATVSYSFRDSAGVVQAVHNALYSGPDDLPYYPR